MRAVTSGANPAEAREKTLLQGKVAIVYALSHYYLFLPFAALCMVAALLQRNIPLVLAALPFLLQIVATIAGNRLKEAYDRRGDDNPALWARRYTLMSAFSGLIWGIGALIWFDSSSFAAEAYLVLTYLGLSATEFLVRAAYRPAYFAHAIGSLGPLALLLAMQGGVYPTLSAILVIYFGGVLYSYGGTAGDLLGESILLRHEHDLLISRLNNEKQQAEATRDTARESDRAKSIFVSNISHELRTPLSAILSMAQLLERGDLEKAQRDHVKVLLEAGRGLKTLLDDIIALASQPDEALSTPPEGCDAAQAARTVTRLLQPNAWEKRLRLSINIAPGLPHVAADPRVVRRVLLKLVGNAIKYTDRGNIEIALAVHEDASQRKMVHFRITDSGPGIPSQMLATIFQPFNTTDEPLPSKRESGGIGLAVAKHLVEAAGGRIGVESEPGMGATFWVMLPATQAFVPEAASDAENAGPPAGLSLLAYLPGADMRKNSVTFSETLAEAAAMSARCSYAAIITIADKADALAAAPGQRTPILAFMSAEDQLANGADGIVRWPSSAEAFYAALLSLTNQSGAAADAGGKDANIDSMIDAQAIAELEKSLGFKTLIDILQSYLHTAEELAAALSGASKRDDWTNAGRLAQDFAGAAGGLGLTAVTAAARALAQGARDGASQETLSTAASVVLSEHNRVREALRRLYPDLSA